MILVVSDEFEVTVVVDQAKIPDIIRLYNLGVISAVIHYFPVKALNSDYKWMQVYNPPEIPVHVGKDCYILIDEHYKVYSCYDVAGYEDVLDNYKLVINLEDL